MKNRKLKIIIKKINFNNYTDKCLEEKLRSFYNNDKLKFKEKLFKGPPDCFRALSWLVVCEIPLERNINIYHNYLAQDLEEEQKDLIIQDVVRTSANINMNREEKIKIRISLYNVLKSFFNLDENFRYHQGTSYIVIFLLFIFEENRLDTFYMLISLLLILLLKENNMNILLEVYVVMIFLY